MVGRLERSLYGTSDAALNLNIKCTKVLGELGFTKGASSPSAFFHTGRRVCMTVHGDDFVSEGTLSVLRWVEQKLKERVELNTECCGFGESLQKEVWLLNRNISWNDWGIRLEADPRRVEIVLKDLNLDDERATSAVTPGRREDAKEVEKNAVKVAGHD